MIKINTKLVLFNVLPYEYKYLEEYLEKMALKGWKLKSMTGGFLKFKKVEPREIKYSVDIMDKISFLDGKNSDVALDYREYCSVSGWNFVCERDKIQVYCSESEIESVPIHTDEREKFDCIFKASLKHIFLNLFTVMMIIFMQYNVIVGSMDASFLASNLQLASMVIVTVFGIHELIGLINFSIWIINGKISLKKEEEVSYDYFTVIKIRSVIRNIMLTGSISMMLLMIIDEQIYAFKFLIGILLTVGAIYLSMNFVSKSRYKQKRKINVISFVVITIIGLMITNVLIFSAVFLREDVNYNEENKGEYTLTLKGFNDEAKYDETPYIIEDSSFLAYSLFYSDLGEKIDLLYYLFESEYEWVINYNFNKQIRWYNKNDIKYIEKETDFPENIKVYEERDGFYYIMVSANKMIRVLNAEKLLNEDELLNTIYELIMR